MLLCRWTLVHESTPMRGPVYAALPATVREVAESNIYTHDALQFMEGLGARTEYAVVKTGNYYVCHHQGLEIQVRGAASRRRRAPPNGSHMQRFDQHRPQRMPSVLLYGCIRVPTTPTGGGVQCRGNRAYVSPPDPQVLDAGGDC